MRKTTKQDLDEKYLGRRLPGTKSQREQLLKDLKDMLEEYGEAWVVQNAGRLLSEAQFVTNELIF